MSSYGDLTNQDIAEILRTRMDGYTVKAIAERLHVYPGVVFKLFRKTKNRPEPDPEPPVDAVEKLARILDRLA